MLPARPGRGQPGSGLSWSPLFGLDVAAVSDRTLPLDLVRGVQLGQQLFVQPLPHADFLPRSQSAPGRHPAPEPELGRQMLPADTGVEHEQDPLQHEPVIKRLAARVAKPPLPQRQQRLDPLPQPIRHIPRLRPHRHPPKRVTTDADGLR